MVKIIEDKIITRLILDCMSKPEKTEDARIYQVIDILMGFVEFDMIDETIDSILVALHNRLQTIGK